MLATSRICNICGVDKPLTEFNRHAKGKYGRRTQCKPCQIKYQKAWRRANPDRMKAIWARSREHPEYKPRQRRMMLVRVYGITDDDYERLLASQDGVCGICREARDYRLCVDHEHDTGAVRGLLCKPCNLGIGNLSTPPKLKAALAYLSNPPFANL